MSTHRCHATGCEVEVPPRMLMCVHHWRMIPKQLQREVWKHYVPGQEITKTPTGAYMRAMLDAIKAVAAVEGRLPEEAA